MCLIGALLSCPATVLEPEVYQAYVYGTVCT